MQIIERENRRVLELQAAAIVAIMPQASDRALLRDRFYASPHMTIAELARKHGSKKPNAMTNYLIRILGSTSEIGAIEPVLQVIGQLPVAIAEKFVSILQEYEDRDQLTQPILGAISHLEYASTYSPLHRQQAVLGISRLRWFEKNPINNRGLTNKLLQRLVNVACFYVHEINDALHDQHDPRGLSDDIRVLTVVGAVVREFRTK